MRFQQMFLMTTIVAACAFADSATWASESTPAERQETRELNIKALKGAQAAPTGASANQAMTMQAPPMQTPPLQAPRDTMLLPSSNLSAAVNLPPVIANANVVSREGETVGLVQRIQMDSAGKPVSVDVALKGTNKTVTLDARNVSYDAMDNLVIASHSSAQIRELPAKYQQG